MKTSDLFISIAAAFCLTACNNNLNPEYPVTRHDGDGSVCELTVDIPFDGEFSTKVTGQTEAKESLVNNCQVFVFRADNGKLDASKYESSLTGAGSHSTSLKCTVGDRNVWVLVNVAKDYTAEVADEASFKALTTDLKDNGKSSFVMVGTASQKLSEGQCSVSVGVKRIVSSIVLKKITVDMESPIYQKAGAFQVNKVYLVNVCGRTNMDLSMNPSSVGTSYWYAKLKEETDSAKKVLISDDLATPVTIDHGKSNSTVYTYYAYPNNCDLKTGSTFSARATLLVVEATLDGELYYYPLQMSSLESNKRYTITNLTIHRPGSKNPYTPVLFSTASANITVSAWEETAERSEEI